MAAGPRSAATVLLDTAGAGGVPSWRLLQQQYLERQRVTGEHLINVNNNVNTSSIKTIANSVSFPSLAFCDCCVVVCVPRLPLPLLDCVPVVVVAVVFWLRLEGGRHSTNALNSRRVDIVDVDNGLLPVLGPRSAAVLFAFYDCHCHCRIAL